MPLVTSARNLVACLSRMLEQARKGNWQVVAHVDKAGDTRAGQRRGRAGQASASPSRSPTTLCPASW
jgi:hypothetical protein